MTYGLKHRFLVKRWTLHRETFHGEILEFQTKQDEDGPESGHGEPPDEQRSKESAPASSSETPPESWLLPFNAQKEEAMYEAE